MATSGHPRDGDPFGSSEYDDLPDGVRSLASTILDQFEEPVDGAGADRRAYVLGALSIAADVYGHALTIPDLAARVDGEGTRDGEVARARRTIARDVGIDALPPHPRSYVESYAEALDLPEETVERATDIVHETYGSRDSAPSTAAAAAVYTAALISGDHVSQSDVVRVSDVSQTALKDEYQRQYDHVTGAVETSASVGD